MRNLAESKELREFETGYTGSGAQILQEENNYSYIRKFPKKINTVETLTDEKGNKYNEVTIKLDKENKVYAENNFGEKVFITESEFLGTSNFYFSVIDGKTVLVAEYDGKNSDYFLENGEQYFPENKIDKFKQKIKEVKNTIKISIFSLVSNTLDKVSFLPNRNKKVPSIYSDEKIVTKNSKK